MVRIVYAPPDTRFERATDVELSKLLKIIQATHKWAREISHGAFRRAFIAAGFFWRTPEPSTKYAFAYYVDHACALLHDRWGAEGVDGDALLAGFIAHNDFPIRVANPSIGQTLEIVANPWHGAPCRTPNAWKSLLSGEANLLSPTTPSAARLRELTAQHSVAIHQKTTTGWRQLADGKSIWGGRKSKIWR